VESLCLVEWVSFLLAELSAARMCVIKRQGREVEKRAVWGWEGSVNAALLPNDAFPIIALLTCYSLPSAPCFLKIMWYPDTLIWASSISLQNIFPGFMEYRIFFFLRLLILGLFQKYHGSKHRKCTIPHPHLAILVTLHSASNFVVYIILRVLNFIYICGYFSGADVHSWNYRVKDTNIFKGFYI
jgi:hypothetical protein